jgi:hypothetical protein
MRIVSALLSAVVLGLMSPALSRAQSPSSTQSVVVPRLMTVSGVFQPADGQPPRAVETVTLSIYADATGGAPLWQETQTVSVEANGRYALLLGATRADGIPADVLAAGAEWLGLRFDRSGEREGPRARLTSVPYALRSADADTLGGRPASAYLLAPPSSSPTGSGGSHTAAASGPSSTAAPTPGAPTNDVLPGTANFVAKYVDAANVGAGSLFDTGSFVGLGTTAPQDFFHVRFNNPSGAFTGFAVQNLGNTTTSYSGMLFYDQNGALGQFQGFNNVTHEYRINNIAQGSGFFNGSINFMIGGVSKFFVSPVAVGIGTTAPSPSSNLDVSNAISGSGNTSVNVTTYTATAFGPGINGKKARGTEAAPTSILNNDLLLNLNGTGYGATGFGNVSAANIQMRATENWTDTAQGTAINFSTTANGTNISNPRMTINQNGNVGIGVFGAQANLEVSNQSGLSGAGTMLATTFTNAGSSQYAGRRARGTGLAPTAVQNGDALVSFVGEGYGTTGFSNLPRGGMFVGAAENWTDAAQGTNLTFLTTPTGTNVEQARMIIDPAGKVGIGTPTPSFPVEVARTSADALIATTAYGTGTNSFFIAQSARGTAAAPAAVQLGDVLGGFAMSGFGTTSFNDVFAAIAAGAAENFTDTARGTALFLGTTPVGTKNLSIAVGILPSGSVGIGTPQDANGLPTATDKLQVFGDVRVGNATTNGCLKNFAGTQLVGTCVSDRRFKKNITPFGSALNQLTALQPVHYYWRANEFPEQHFGDAQAYGLIAQDVEQVLPELVVTNVDGYKAIDYSKLPLLTIQAVKELKTENDVLKAQNEDLRNRLDTVERLIREMRSTTTTPR